MNKILLATLDFPPKKGGVAAYLKNVANFFGNQISVIAPPEDNAAGFDLAQNFKVHRKSLLCRFFGPKHLKAFFVIKNIYKKEKAEILAINDILPLGYPAMLLKIFFKISYFVFLHGTDFNLAKRNFWKRFWLRRILNNSEFIVVNSNYLKNEVLKLIPSVKIEVVYPAISGLRPSDENLKKQIISSRQLSGKKIIFSLGRLVKRKGFDKLILSFDGIHTNLHKLEHKSAQIVDSSDVCLVIAGNGPEENYLKDLARKSSCSENIIFLGGISDEEKCVFYDLCDIFALPSRNENGDTEGFGIAYLEAAFFGKPSVAGNIGGVSEAVLNGKTGILVEGENVDEISQAIIRLLKDDDLRKKMGDEARRRVMEEFVANKQISKIKNFL